MSALRRIAATLVLAVFLGGAAVAGHIGGREAQARDDAHVIAVAEQERDLAEGERADAVGRQQAAEEAAADYRGQALKGVRILRSVGGLLKQCEDMARAAG